MGNRWGAGPVFALEWSQRARRWQVYAARSAVAALLLVPLLVIGLGRQDGGTAVYEVLVGGELAAMLLLAPATTAGAFCRDRAAGLLDHLLVTDLSAAEVVLGKLVARLGPLLGLVAAGLPVFFLGALVGGADPEALAMGLAVVVGTGVLAATLTLALSLRGTKTHEVLMAGYAALGAWIGSESIGWAVAWHLDLLAPPEWLLKANPAWLALAPVQEPGAADLGDGLAFLAGCLLASAALTSWTIVRLRAVCGRRGEGRGGSRSAAARRLGWLPGPDLDANPIAWREWRRLRGSRWAERIWMAYLAGAAILSAIAIEQEVGAGWLMGTNFAQTVNGVQVTAGLLLLSVATASAWAEERDPGVLDALLSTPLPASTIVWGKWWGAFRAVPFLALLPAVLAIGPSWRAERVIPPPLIFLVVLGHGAVLTSLGVVLSTRIARTGRAIAASVAAFVLIDLGVFLFAVTRPRGISTLWYQFGLWISSVFAVADLTGAIEWAYGRYDPLWYRWLRFGLLWAAIDVALTLLIVRHTIATFDRSFGRIPPGPGVPRPSKAAPNLPPGRIAVELE
ncbi:MAG TPA: ABC transporter permease [Isosphaeraceae bacterium]|jgi:ABC-type transport system involved in multi-copper enzyme maturation permease subunit|nr:ABC transporter permease [Isosphaeraceae bacterium]